MGFDNATRLYVASGLLTYGASAEMNHTIMHLKRMGVCNEVHHKERYIPQSEMESKRAVAPAIVWMHCILLLLIYSTLITQNCTVSRRHLSTS